MTVPFSRNSRLDSLRLPFLKEQCQPVAATAAKNSIIFNGDSTITSAVLDRLLHHGHTVVIEGSSFRMKDRLEN